MFELSLQERFPLLFSEFRQRDARVEFKLRESPPPDSLISNVNLVPRVGGHWMIVIDQNGHWEIPGGTLEFGENYLDALQRELLEEAGAILKTCRLFGSFHYFSTSQTPYRPYLPHPEFYRVVCVGDVEVLRLPSDPDGIIVKTEVVPLKEAVRRFRSQNRDDFAALYNIAAEIYNFYEENS